MKADEEAAPIARYVPYTRHFFVLLLDRHAALEVKDEALNYMDQLISQCCLSRRVSTKLTFLSSKLPGR